MHRRKALTPDNILYYIRQEKRTLLQAAVTGIVYNVGLVAGPWFEGQMVQKLCDVLSGTRLPKEMAGLAALYVLTMLSVQALRAVKRLSVRVFANSVSRSMKTALYQNLLLDQSARDEQAGVMMAHIIGDADACVEGLRKFITEVFDTGVVMIAYMAMLLYYDARLALICMLFPPLAYLLAGRLKHTVTHNVQLNRESNTRLNEQSLERVTNALTYRAFGQEHSRNAAYEQTLREAEQSAVRANVWESAMPPIYLTISMLGAVPIIFFGARSVLGTGHIAWDIAAFTTFFSVYQKLAVKSSRAARLFNAVQKARVSWQRIRPSLVPVQRAPRIALLGDGVLTCRDVSFAYADHCPLFSCFRLTAAPGEIVGLTGAIAGGKSTLGRVLTGELPYKGRITLGDTVLPSEGGALLNFVGYVGHKPELLSCDIEENILLGEEGDVWPVLRAVQMEKEVLSFPNGIHTPIGPGGVLLSGGQQARIALARALYRPRPLMVLDDPFSAVDRATEQALYLSLRALCAQSVVVLISHRLSLFPELDKVVLLEEGAAQVGTHEELMHSSARYRALYTAQQGVKA